MKKAALILLCLVLAFAAGAQAQRYGGIRFSMETDTLFLGTRFIAVCDQVSTDRYLLVQGLGVAVTPHGCETDAQMRVRLRREAEAAR